MTTISDRMDASGRPIASDMWADVKSFHEKFGLVIAGKPCIPDEGTVLLREGLIDEENDELEEAIRNDDLVEIADACADLIYVVLGLCVSYGIDLRPVFNEVHRTNMAKEGGAKRSDGKICKPDGWQPPQIERILREQGME
jgi:predicted HAD superfamily Cof-like phosphohydrolase